MQASAVSHVAICVRDLERSLGFYRDLLGMRVVLDQVQDTTRGNLPHTYKNVHTQRRVVHLRYGEGDTVPFLVMSEHPGDPPDGEPIKLDQVGISHISFTVPDVAALARELLAKGAKICGPPDAFTNPSGPVGSAFFFDPDGILVQFDSGVGG